MTAQSLRLSVATSAAASILLASDVAAQPPRVEIEVEAGPAWVSRNDVQVPNSASATRFSLNRVTGTGPWPAGRVYVTWNVNARHGLRVLVAPLSITETGMLSDQVRFAGGTYSPGSPVEATYTFNSYRLAYRYQLRNTDRTRAWVGFSGKIRDATVRLSQGTTSTRTDDLGFVPLLHLAGDWRMSPTWSLGTDIEALAGGPGRAIDAAVKLGYDRGGRLAMNLGYRTVEGGADVDDVYNFAWLHYGVASLVWRW